MTHALLRKKLDVSVRFDIIISASSCNIIRAILTRSVILTSLNPHNKATSMRSEKRKQTLRHSDK